MAIILLTKGFSAIVDDEDFNDLSKYNWYVLKQGDKYYRAVRHSNKNETYYKNRKTILMHRQILGFNLNDKRKIDHINHNPLDNRKQNLRICTSIENSQNSIKRENVTSVYKGVSFHKNRKKYQAYIHINKKYTYLGFHENEIDTALAYNKAAKEHFKEFAFLNKI
jgi:hypothetical protein